jgi:hypothetical protein
MTNCDHDAGADRGAGRHGSGVRAGISASGFGAIDRWSSRDSTPFELVRKHHSGGFRELEIVRAQ